MRTFKAKSKNQAEYVRSVYDNDMVFCIGPPGAGKTACAIGTAVSMFEKGIVTKIVLARPVVTVDNIDNIGFLPGDLEAKMDPYLRPMFDEIFTYYDKALVGRMMHENVLEISPLEYLRGRTFHNSVVILDEAQNATYSQLKMITTRLGRKSKMIINGDITQSDINNSGLQLWYDKIVNDIVGIGRVELERSDIVRHKLVSAIVGKCEDHET